MKDYSLGKKLKCRRQEKAMTLAEVSKLTGIHTSYLGRIESSDRFPSAHVLQKLTKPLGYSEAELMKLAGYLSLDETDEQLAKAKEAIKNEIQSAMTNLLERVDSL